MKRFISFAFVFVVAFGFVFTAQADTVMTLSSPDVEINNNRLFEVVVYAECSDGLAAGTFELEYDSSLMEYRSVSTGVSAGQVKAVDKGDKIKAIFLQCDGVGKKEEIKLFSVKFKSVNYGSCDVKISATDCVNSSANELTCKPVAVCKVTVTDKAVSDDDASDDYLYDEEDDEKGDNKDKKKDENKEEAQETESDNGFSVAPDTSYKKYIYALTILIVIMFVMIVCLARYIFTSNKRLISKLEKENEENTEN